MTPIVVPMTVAMRDRDEGDEDRDPAADERSGEDVATQRVGAQQVARQLARRLVREAQPEVLLERGLLGADDREQGDHRDRDQPDDREPVAQEPPERAPAGRLGRAATTCSGDRGGDVLLAPCQRYRIRGSAKP